MNTGITDKEKHDDLSAWIAVIATGKSPGIDAADLAGFVAVAELLPGSSRGRTLDSILRVLNEHGF